jgi:tRNA (guanine37-N1)-methyltransferase
MVMRADVWGHAIDDVISEGAVLAIPTPSGGPLTQRDLERLSTAKQIVIACGRYEGIDARVAEHYRTSSVEVFEYSLGDYVLNGGEVAAIALVEGVSRLVEGVIGNPESLAEESHSAEGLLEYPVYTLPRSWRGLETPAVLFSGDHSRIRRWRRDQALSRTAARRPDMIEKLLGRGSELDRDDSEVLTARGIDISGGGGGFTFEVATPGDIAEVADLAARTFPLACPPGTTQSEIDDHVATHLSVDALLAAVEDGARITIARSLKDGAHRSVCTDRRAHCTGSARGVGADPATCRRFIRTRTCMAPVLPALSLTSR